MFRLIDAIRDLDQIYWPASQHANEISVGDTVILWLSGPAAGVYAFGSILAAPRLIERVPDPTYWIMPRRFANKAFALVGIRNRFLTQPILRKDIKTDPLLSMMQVIRGPIGTNFRVTPDELRRIQELVKR